MAYPRRFDWRTVRRAVAGFVVAFATSIACNADPAPGGVSFASHCGAADRDATCVANYPSRPWCSLCADQEDKQGCVSTPPVPQCDPNGGISTAVATGDGGDDTTSTSSTSGMTTIGVDDTMSDDSTTGPFGCDGTGYDDACEGADPTTPFCVEGVCASCAEAGGDAFCGESVDPATPACDMTGGDCVACDGLAREVCDGVTPVCGVSGACEACDEHADCPGGACHLSPNDTLVGACFDLTAAIWVDNTAICPGMGTMAAPSCSLAGSLNGLADGASKLIKVVPTGVPVTARVDVAGDLTVAIVGVGGAPILSGSNAMPGGALVVSGGALAYVVNMRMSENPLSHGMTCTGAELWLTDAEVANNAGWGIFDTGPCNLTLRRTTLHHNALGGVRVLGGTLDLVNATVAVNGNGSSGPGLEVQFGEIDVLYSTIAGNAGLGPDSLTCNTTTGVIRNSIVQGAQTNSIELDCFGLTMQRNALDNSNFAVGTNVLVPGYNAAQFVSPINGDLRLAAPPLSPFGSVALWEEGDPPLDADGSPRPTDGSLGYAGIDEPG